MLDRVVLVAAFASIAPDLDLALGLGAHRGWTHSIVGAAGIGLACALVARLRGAERVAVVLAALLHVPMDWSTGEPGAPASYGVPWAWPFSPVKHIAAHPWFGAFHIDEPGFLAQMFHPRAVPVYGREIATVATAIAIAAAVRATTALWPRRIRTPGP